MAIDLRHYRILLSCPGDITDEKEVIEHEIAAFNRLYGIRNGISLDLMHWSTDVYPESGSAPQTAINKQIVHDCDAAIALFWTRFGSQTERYGSGTEEEIEELIRRGTQVFLYFSKKMIHPDAIDNEQYSKVKAFKERYSSRGIFFDYSTIEEFETLIRNHIALYFLQFINKAGGSQNKSILSVKSAKNGQLFDELITHQTRIRSGFQKVKEKINSLFPKIEKIHIEKPKQIPSDIPFGISNRELLKKLNIFENEQVSFEGKVKSTVLSYAEKENMVCCENFFEVGKLCKQRDLGASVMHYVKYNYFGTPEEKEKGELIWKLYSKIKRYEQYAAWADGLDSKRYIEFVLSNNGTTYDEDIDVRVIVKKGLLCTRDDLPMPGSDIIGEITDNLEKFFIPDPAMNIDLYNSRKDRIIPPHLPISALYYSSHDNSDEEHDKYSRELDYIFSYNVFSDNGFDVITFKQPYLKHNSNVFFPTRLYFNDIPDSINYEIRSKKFPEVIRNELRIPK